MWASAAPRLPWRWMWWGGFDFSQLAGWARHNNGADGNIYAGGHTGDNNPSDNSFAFIDNPDTGMYNPSANELGFSTDGIERMRIDDVGDVGIASNAPSYRLELPNTASSAGQGRANAWQTYSDGRFKTDIRVIDRALEKVMALKGITYRSVLDKKSAREVGLIAQDVEKVLPEAVSISNTEVALPGEKPKKVFDYRSLAYDRLAALMVEAIKELKPFVDGLAVKVEERIVQVTGHDAAIKEPKAANDNLRLELKTANDSYASGLKSLREVSARQQAEIKELRSPLKAAPAKEPGQATSSLPSADKFDGTSLTAKGPLQSDGVHGRLGSIDGRRADPGVAHPILHHAEPYGSSRRSGEEKAAFAARFWEDGGRSEGVPLLYGSRAPEVGAAAGPARDCGQLAGGGPRHHALDVRCSPRFVAVHR